MEKITYSELREKMYNFNNDKHITTVGKKVLKDLGVI